MGERTPFPALWPPWISRARLKRSHTRGSFAAVTRLGFGWTIYVLFIHVGKHTVVFLFYPAPKNTGCCLYTPPSGH